MKEVRKLTGKLSSLNSFISRSGERCAPFFEVLKKARSFEWTEDYQSAFQALKEYLASPTVLCFPKPGEPLLLYLGVLDSAVSSVLVRELNSTQIPVYYVSHSLVDVETQYSQLEKHSLSLVITSRRLKPYFQAHIFKLVSNRPLRQLLQKPDHSGRLAKSTVELSEFSFEFLPRIAIKAQVLADFIADFSPSDLPDAPHQNLESEHCEPEPTLSSPDAKPKPSKWWKMFVDGASRLYCHGFRVVLISPGNLVISYELRLSFQTTNNQDEYEALLIGLRLAAEMAIPCLKVFCDSQLIVHQVTIQCKTANSILSKYCVTALALMTSFTHAELSHISK